MENNVNLFKSMRLKSGLSQGAVAKKMGYTSGQFVSNWERDLSVPPVETIPKIAKIYGVDQKDFIDKWVELRVADFRRDLLSRLKVK
jgi:transcriptional regulator with XRE-family HTH domain